MSAVEELDKLKKLHADGTITDEQYERAKAKLEEETEHEERDAPRDTDERAEADEREERRPRRRSRRDEDAEDDHDRRLSPKARRKRVREWSTFLHLSLFASYAVPLGGIIAPIVIWQTQKDELPELNEHGKNAVNWIISFIIYATISVALCFVFVGFVLLPLVFALNIVFPIVAAMKANEGRVWKYPLAIPFLT
jgi:uncharacterized protein